MASEERDLPSLLRSDYPLSPENLPRAPDPPPSLDQLPVGSRLGACLPAWRKIQADTWTLDQGSLPFVSHAPSTIQCSSDLLPIWRSGEARDIGGFGVGDDRKEGCRTSVANKFIGVLQPAFPGTEEGRLLETRHRPVRSQQSPHNSLLSYGDVRADHECRPSGRVADLVGPDRCVLSRTHLPDTQEVSSLCGEGSGLSVHRSPVRTVDGSICLLETGQVCGAICSYSQSFSPPIPRRLAPQSTHPFYVK